MPARSQGKGEEREREAYRIINDILRSRIVVDVDGDAPEGGDLRREFREPRVVLALALVGVGHGGNGRPGSKLGDGDGDGQEGKNRTLRLACGQAGDGSWESGLRGRREADAHGRETIIQWGLDRSRGLEWIPVPDRIEYTLEDCEHSLVDGPWRFAGRRTGDAGAITSSFVVVLRV